MAAPAVVDVGGLQFNVGAAPAGPLRAVLLAPGAVPDANNQLPPRISPQRLWTGPPVAPANLNQGTGLYVHWLDPTMAAVRPVLRGQHFQVGIERSNGTFEGAVAVDGHGQPAVFQFAETEVDATFMVTTTPHITLRLQ